MIVQAATVAEFYPGADDAVGTDEDVVAQFSTRIDNRGRMNLVSHF